MARKALAEHMSHYHFHERMAAATDGSLTAAVSALGNGYGLEWGEQLTAGLRTDTAFPFEGSARLASEGELGSWLGETLEKAQEKTPLSAARARARRWIPIRRSSTSCSAPGSR